MAAPNIVNVSTIRGNTDVLAVTTTTANITFNQDASSKVYKINSLLVANIDGAESADISAFFYRAGTDYSIGKTITVPPDTTAVIVSKDTAIYLEENDGIRLLASADNDLEAICSYEEIS